MANVYPKNIQFLLADAVRQEQGGKLTVLGLYSGDSVLLKDTLPKEVPDGMEGLALSGLTVVALVRDGQGAFDCTLQLFAPGGKALGKGVSKLKVDKQKEASTSLIFPIEPFPIPDFGIYRIVLQLGKHEYEFKFKVVHADPSATFPKLNMGKKAVPSKGKPIPGSASARSETSKATPGKRKI